MVIVRENRERERTSRETLGKFFYDLAKLAFAGMVIGSMTAFNKDAGVIDTIYRIAIGVIITTFLAAMGRHIIK